MKLSLLSEYAWKGTKSYEWLVKLAALLAAVASGILSGRSADVLDTLERVIDHIDTDDGDEQEQQKQKLDKQYLWQHAIMARKERNLSLESAIDIIKIIQRLIKHDDRPV
jgi:hypothetical protein